MKRTFRSFDRITVDPDVLGGKPCIRGLRLSVARVLDILSQNPSWDDLQQDYPELESEDIAQVLRFASATLGEQVIPLDSPAACDPRDRVEVPDDHVDNLRWAEGRGEASP